MLKRILNKKVRIGVAFAGVTSTLEATSTKYYEGVIIDCDDNFVMFDDGSMIAIKYIQTIQVL